MEIFFEELFQSMVRISIPELTLFYGELDVLYPG
jgi:hypothetical protein